MPVPQVVIVGRPNVGKSSLFNWLAGRRLAIVDPTSGVTRDRVSHLVEINDRFVELVDTGGMGVRDADNLTEQIESQIQTAIDSASLIIFVVDVRDGVTPLDQEVNKRLRQVDVPILCVANKADSPSLTQNVAEFCRFGRGVQAVSAKNNIGKQELLDAIAQHLPPADDEQIEEPVMKVAIVGRRNVGKSTFVNTLAQAERMITSEVPGTTRDSVDVRFELDGKAFIAIDTPGFRRSKAVNTNLDFYGTHRAERSIRRADVVLLFFDPTQRISKPDKQFCDYIAENFKPCVFVVNKWDLVAREMPTNKWVAYLRDTFRTMTYAPIAFVTGQTGKNVKALLNHAQMLFNQSRTRISTGQLNKLVRAAIERNPPPLYHSQRPKIYYATQVAVQPPTIVLFVSNPQAIAKPYQRFLLSALRDNLKFGEVPIKLYLRSRSRDDSTDEIERHLAKPEPKGERSGE